MSRLASDRAVVSSIVVVWRFCRVNGEAGIMKVDCLF